VTTTRTAIGAGILLAIVAWAVLRLFRLIRSIERQTAELERLSDNEGRDL
jgi:hypothetical protein